MIIRAETPADILSIHALTAEAFAGAARSSGTEPAIVDALRKAGALYLSLVAVQDGVVVGHVAFSPVLIDGRDFCWMGLGPISVLPPFQHRGIGTALIEEGLRKLRRENVGGCVVLGDPGYYGRFGFSASHALSYDEVPPEYFQSLVMTGGPAAGTVTYHAGFDATGDRRRVSRFSPAAGAIRRG